MRGDDEIARLARAFNRMTSALAESQQRQHQLIADARHELRTPLTSLRTNIELLARGAEQDRQLPPDQYRRLLASVTSQLDELTELIRGLTLLDPEQDEPMVRCRLDEIARRAVERARHRGDHTIELDLEPTEIVGDDTTTLPNGLVAS